LRSSRSRRSRRISQRVLFADAEHRHEHRGLALEAGGLVGVLEAVDHRRGVGQAEVRAVGAREQDEVLEVACGVGLAGGADEHLAAFGLDRPAGQVERRAADRVGHVIERQAVAPQGGLGDLDRHLVGPGVGQFGDADLRQGREVVADGLRDVSQRVFVGLAVDRDVDDLPPVGQFLDDRFLGFLGERVDGVDASLDVVEQFA